MSKTPAEQIVWIDCEMTGLNVDNDRLCEIAIIVTDFDLNPLDAGFEIVINPGAEALTQMNDFVRQMHKDSGLLAELDSGVSAEEAQRASIKYIKRFVKGDKRAIVAGNSIGVDRRFLSKYMPELDEFLHYRSIDVSTIKELARRWHPKAFYETPKKNGGHRALADIAESIRELAYFQKTVMQPSPGIDSNEAKEAALEVTTRFDPLIS